MHLVRQAVSVRVRKKANRRSPVRTAPRRLVAANSTASSTTARSIVAMIAPSCIAIVVLMQQGVFEQHFNVVEAKSITPR